MVTVAVDGNGADLGPDEVAQGASLAAARGVRVLLFADASRISAVPDGVDLVDAPVSIAKATDPAYAVRATPEASIVQAAKAVAEGRAQALVSGGSTGSALAAGLFNLKRDRGIYRPALALPIPRPGRRATAAARRRRQRDLPPRASGAVRAHGLGLRAGRARHRRSARGAALKRRGAGQGHPRSQRGP